MPAYAMIDELETRLQDKFSKADLEPTKGTKDKSNRKRWEVTARFAIYQGLKRKGLIAADGKNMWYLTSKGRDALKKLPEEPSVGIRRAIDV